MSVTRTFTVTVANPGAGNRYYIDGILQDTVNLAEGGTYKFDVSDSSVSGHPFKFSTTSNGTHNGGSEYTTGVTTSGTAGQADAYVQIVVADSAPQLYYYCQYHSGMGGSANTVEADSWGMLAWGELEFGNQDSNSVTLTGLSFSAEVGIAVGSSEQGWGNSTWGTSPYGESFSPVVSIDGLSITSELGELPYAQSEEGWGRDEWGIGNWGQNTTKVLLDGLSMSASLGPDGWGINSFGDGQWGGEFTFKPESIIVPTGQTLSAALGSATIGRLDMIFSISSPGTIGVGLGTPSINNGADHQQGLASFAVPAAVGSVTATPNTIAELTGLTTTAEVASLSVGSVELIDLTGVVLKGAIGSTTTDAMRVGLSGVSFEADVGEISPTNMTVGLTGQAFTASLQTVGFGQIGYQDVDITGNTSYTDVNHAA
jgi:hypothetical protein